MIYQGSFISWLQTKYDNEAQCFVLFLLQMSAYL